MKIYNAIWAQTYCRANFHWSLCTFLHLRDHKEHTEYISRYSTPPYIMNKYSINKWMIPNWQQHSHHDAAHRIHIYRQRKGSTLRQNRFFPLLVKHKRIYTNSLNPYNTPYTNNTNAGHIVYPYHNVNKWISRNYITN